jgi:hypothetical protein
MKHLLSKLADLNGSFYIDSETAPILIGGIALAAVVIAIAFL